MKFVESHIERPTTEIKAHFHDFFGSFRRKLKKEKVIELLKGYGKMIL
jgi:hypothetical protein